MRLYIHTYGRPHRQTTLSLLPAALRARTSLVVQAREAEAYRQHAGPAGAAELLVLPKNIITLSPTRQWIMEQHNVRRHGPKLCLLDDDLRFDKRRLDVGTLFIVSSYADIASAFKLLESVLDTFAHAGLLAREGGNRVDEGETYRLATRMTRVLAYDVTKVRKAKARFDRVPCKQDFDMTLQLLRAGLPNYVSCSYVQGQSTGSQAEGGCSGYRTLKMLDAAAKTLVKLHPDFVTAVRKSTTSAWGGTKEHPVERTEVVVQWKQALLSSGAALPTKLSKGLR